MTENIEVQLIYISNNKRLEVFLFLEFIFYFFFINKWVLCKVLSWFSLKKKKKKKHIYIYIINFIYNIHTPNWILNLYFILLLYYIYYILLYFIILHFIIIYYFYFILFFFKKKKYLSVNEKINSFIFLLIMLTFSSYLL